MVNQTFIYEVHSLSALYKWDSYKNLSALASSAIKVETNEDPSQPVTIIPYRRVNIYEVQPALP